jgi:hypothetical protein
MLSSRVGRSLTQFSLTMNARLRSKEPSMLWKLDIEKTEDHVNWDFLLYMLKVVVSKSWRKWMVYCISSLHFSVLVNGILLGFFSSS